MSNQWADKIAEQLLNKKLLHKGICLILGASDTGKTTLAAALVNRAVSSRPVGIIDADIGQSHIGPPTTVGWAVLKPSRSPVADLSDAPIAGFSFVGDVTPTRHLLQLTAGLAQAVHELSGSAELIIIDTPGFVCGPAATALWWTVNSIIKPNLIVAVQQEDELSEVLKGLCLLDTSLEMIEAPPQIQPKSPSQRQNYRKQQFNKYFKDSRIYDLSLTGISIQASGSPSRQNLVNRLVALRNGRAADVALGIITAWNDNNNTAQLRAPAVDIEQVRCLVIGDISLELDDN
ncbi:MAG: Clp1/GlmU family protein [Planctomycetota bacterium]|jgi:polynucleotide 5'-hydroxyl-kinase GRC3/NOL9